MYGEGGLAEMNSVLAIPEYSAVTVVEFFEAKHSNPFAMMLSTALLSASASSDVRIVFASDIATCARLLTAHKCVKH